MSYKSQTAAEYTIILAIVLLIVTLILLMMQPLQLFATNTKHTAVFWEQGLIGIYEFEIGDITLITLQNNLPQGATVQNVTFTTTQDYTILEHEFLQKNSRRTFVFADPISCTSGDTIVGNLRISFNTTPYIQETEVFENKKYEITCN